MRRGLLRCVIALPGPLRRRILFMAFSHAEDALNRGDFEAVFAAFAEDVAYMPPSRLPGAAPMTGKVRVMAYWNEIAVRFESEIETSELRELERGEVFRAATLRHVDRETGEILECRFEQVTEIAGGQVVRQLNTVVG
jgi:ketosteroid isomerase-like protein